MDAPLSKGPATFGDAIDLNVRQSIAKGPLRVLHVYKDVFPPVVGGVEMQIDALRRAMPDVESTVVVCARALRTVQTEVAGGREIRVAEFGPRLLSVPLAPTFPLWIARAEADVIHLHMPNPTGEAAALIARRGRGMIVSYHADIVRQARFARAYRPLVQACLRRADAIVVGSETLFRSSPYLQGHDGKVRVIPHLVDVERFDRKGVDPARVEAIRDRFGDRIVISVGRLVYYKGHEYLLEAARGLNASFLIVGDGPQRERIEAEARGISNVHLLGEVSEADLLAHLAASDCFALASSSRAESFGIAVAEAQAMGLPAVIADTGAGTAEAVEDGVSGIVVPPRDARALRSALGILLSDAKRREAMGHAARRRAVSRHALQDRAAEISALYREVAEAAGR